MITRRRHLVKSNIKKINESKKKELNKNVEKLEEFKTSKL
jgi:hypothetical protein